MAKAKNPATAQADADASAYVRGDMQINEQVSTFHLFMGLTNGAPWLWPACSCS
ncbi:hypothetical protein SMCF_2649 [Streptomyces coelicoflavus ZG0656]|nr:hypothetical protein SMCF_2649 [Streptomyces coelicoflavus ZG0656]